MKRSWFYLALASSFLIAGLLLRPIPLDPDTNITRLHVLGTLAYFTFWAIGIFSWGAVITHALKLPSSFAIRASIGAVAASILPQVMLIATIPFFVQQTLAYFLTILGPAVFGFLKLEGPRRPQKSDRVWIPSLTIGAILLINTCLPHFHSDPLMYGLLGPRLWSQAGQISFDVARPHLLVSSNWEYLTIWANALLGGDGPKGLIEVQLFAQWIHTFFGFGISLVAVTEILVALGFAIVPARLGSVAVATTVINIWTAYLAKNDWGASAWALTGFLILLLAKSRQRSPLIIAGLFLGSALSAKMALLFFVAPVAGWWLATHLRLRKRETVFQATALALGFFLAVFPFLMRNFLLTENPIYPLALKIFPTPGLTPEFIRLFSAPFDYSRPGFELFIKRIGLLLWGGRFALAGFAFLIWMTFKRKLTRQQWALWLCPVSAILLFVFVGAPVDGDDGMLMMRYLTPSLALLAAASLCFMWQWRWKSRHQNRIRTAIAVLFILMSFWETRRIIMRIPTALKMMGETAQIVRHEMMGGESKAWLRLNAKPDDLIMSTGDNQLYYVSHLNAFVLTENPIVAGKTAEMRSPTEWLKLMKVLQPKYIFDTTHWMQRYWSNDALFLDQLVALHPDAVVFKGKDSFVVDFEKLN